MLNLKEFFIKAAQLILFIPLLCALMVFGFMQLQSSAAENKPEKQKTTVQNSRLDATDLAVYEQDHKAVMRVIRESKDPKQVQEAVDVLKALAKLDYAPAQNDLGMMYLQGIGFAVDKSKAAYWVSKAAQSQYDEAAYNLSLMYSFGDGVKKDAHKSKQILERPLLKDHLDAQESLALLYLTGKAGRKDTSKAMAMFKKTAEAGHVSSQFRLGMIFKEGKLVDQDLAQARKWLEMAAQKGHQEAISMLKSEEFQPKK